GIASGELFLNPLARRDVAYDGQAAHELSAVADQRRVLCFEHDVGGGLARAVAAAVRYHHPAFQRRDVVLVLTGVLEERKHVQRRTPYDFLGLHAADPRHPLAPQRVAGLPVEGEDAVGAAVDQLLGETLLTTDLGFGPPALGRVARHLREAHQHPLRVVNRRDHHVGPEARAVLAHPPAFVFELPVSHRPLELPLRLALAHVLRGIKPGEVQPENLFCAVALGPIVPRVPAHYVSFWVYTCHVV